MKISINVIRLVLIAAILLVASCGSTSVVPMLELPKLLDDSDTIVIGQIESMQSSTESIRSESGISGYAITAGIRIDDVLKGSQVPKHIFVRFFLPDPPIGNGSVGAGSYRIVFLKRFEQGYKFADPYHPSIVAAPGKTIAGGTTLDQIVSAVARVVESPVNQPTEKIEAVYILSGVQNQLV